MKCIFLIIPVLFFTIIKSYGQDDKQKANESVAFICSCTENALLNGSVDTKKMAEIVASYKLKNVLLEKYKTDVRLINTQLDAKYSQMESSILDCKEQFKTKYRLYFSSDIFNNQLKLKFQECPYLDGPKLIKTLANYH